MQRLIVFIKRFLLTWLLVVVSITTFDFLLVVAKTYSGYIGVQRWGMPYAYLVDRHDDDYHWLDDGDPPPPPPANDVETTVLLGNVAGMGVVALVSAMLWPPYSPSKAPSMRSPPPADVVRRYELHIADLDRRSRRCLRRTIVGSLLGLGLIFGALGWLRGWMLSATYTDLGRVPPWTATAAWAVGRAIVCALLVGILGLLFAR